MKQKGRVDVEELYRGGKFWLRNKKRKHYNKNKWGEGLCMNDRNKRGLE